MAGDIVVFVDDQPEVLESLRRLLRHEAYEVRTTASPQEALGWLEAGDVGVLVADERMPEMRGCELLARASSRAPRTARVILTGYPGSETAAEARRLGVDGLISKPWNDEALKLTLRQLLEERRRPDAAGFEERRLQALGRLAAGLAHELNGPLGYILSNLASVEGCIDDLRRLARPGQDVDFLAEDATSAIRDSRQGAERIRDLVRELQDFARGEEGSDLLRCLENALRIAWNELKYTAQVERDLQPLPSRACAGMTPVFLELLLAAGEAVGKKGILRLSSRVEDGWAVVRIGDTGGAARPPTDEARRIVEGLGGRIEHKPGEAAVFLPLSRPAS